MPTSKFTRIPYDSIKNNARRLAGTYAMRKTSEIMFSSNGEMLYALCAILATALSEIHMNAEMKVDMEKIATTRNRRDVVFTSRLSIRNVKA